MATNNSNSNNLHLLSLPGEIRNMIWRYTVVEDSTPNRVLTITSNIFPPIICTCRQTRSEVIGIYLGENSFHFDINDFDTTLFTRFLDTLHLDSVMKDYRGRVPHSFRWRLRFTSDAATIRARRANLLAYVKASWSKPYLPLPWPTSQVGRDMRYRLPGMLRTVSILKKQVPEWENAKIIVVSMIDAAAICGEERLS
jgi:hypothetical protein